MDKYAVIVAAGSGSRMAHQMPKQFLPLAGKTILYYTLAAFVTAFADIKIILVLPEAHLDKGEQVAKEIPAIQHIQILAGGASRFQSVQNGLQQVITPSVVFVHDGVRCMVSKTLIQNCYQQALTLGSAIPAVAATDTIRIAEETTNRLVDRNQVRIIQTPQTFLSSIILPAFQQAERPSFTDEASVVEANGQPIYLIEGEYNNIKITRPIDLIIAEKIFDNQLSLK